MSRTGRNLFNQLTVLSEPVVVTKQGRSEILIAKRDTRLIHRYLYYCIYTELRPDAITERLEEEFELSPTRLFSIIYNNAAELRSLRSNPPTIAQLQTKYSFMVWRATK